MRGSLTDIPEAWDYPSSSSALESDSVTMVNFLCEKIFYDYEPAQFHPIKERVVNWLNNFDKEADQQNLLALLLDTFFIGRREFESLYRSAFSGSLFRWILSDMDIDIFSADMEKQVFNRINSAWICPVSGSLRINSFLKVNGLKSMDKRPDWRSMRQFGDVQKIRAYVKRRKIKDLVLLEDFVGSGTQASGAIKFAAKTLPDVRILFCPLVVCPKGDQAISELIKTSSKENDFARVTYEPALVLPKDCIHDYEAFANGQGTELERFICAQKSRLGAKSDKQMFGFEETGAKIVMFSNCPNNTLPIFHAETSSWTPLFPRVNRQ